MKKLFVISIIIMAHMTIRAQICGIISSDTTICASDTLQITAYGQSSLYSLCFDGIDDVVDIPNALFGGGDRTQFTIEVWAKSSDTTQAHGHIYSKDAFWREVRLRYPSGALSFFYAYPNSYYGVNSGKIGSTWTHIAIVMDNTNMAMYLNGHIEASSVTNGTISWQTDPGTQHLGGGIWAGSMYYFNGCISAFRISGNARYSGDFTPPTYFTNDINTEILYTFSEGSGATLYDSSGHGNHGTINNATWVPDNPVATTYSWSTGDTTATILITPLIGSTYYCTITMGSTSCVDSIRVDVNNPDAKISGRNTLCEGDTINLTASGGISFLWSDSSAASGITINDSGAYWVIVMDSSGCTDADSIYITKFALPDVYITPTVDTLCINYNYITLTGNPGVGNFSGSGIFADNFYPDSAGAGVHLITYSYNDSNSCENSDTISIYVDLCTNIDNYKNSKVIIYPNPVTDIINIEGLEGGGGIILYNISSKEAYYYNNNSSNIISIDMSEFVPGQYLINTGGKSFLITKL